jgi:hypothetical protein
MTEEVRQRSNGSKSLLKFNENKRVSKPSASIELSEELTFKLRQVRSRQVAQIAPGTAREPLLASRST